MERTTPTSKSRVWIAEVGVFTLPGCSTLSPGVKGAYVSALACAETEAEFRARCTEALEQYHLVPFEFSDVEPLEVRCRTHSPIVEILELADEVEATHEVRFGSFYTFSKLN